MTRRKLTYVLLLRFSGKVVSDFSVTPWTVACQAPLSVEFLRQEYWSELPFPSPGDLPNPGVKPWSPTLQADSLPSEPPGKPQREMRKTVYLSHLMVTLASHRHTRKGATVLNYSITHWKLIKSGLSQLNPLRTYVCKGAPSLATYEFKPCDKIWLLEVKVKLLSRVRLFATPWTVAYQAPPSMGFSRQEY